MKPCRRVASDGLPPRPLPASASLASSPVQRFCKAARLCGGLFVQLFTSLSWGFASVPSWGQNWPMILSLGKEKKILHVPTLALKKRLQNRTSASGEQHRQDWEALPASSTVK